MFKNRILLFHLITALVVIIWGTTFVSTKVLIQHGLGPIEIMFYRFVLAYFCLLMVSHKRLWADNWKDEFMLMLSGLTGGTFYFVAENTALGITQASNVALLVCTTPIFTALLVHWIFKEPLRRNMIIGSIIALIGVGLVVFSGSVLLQINPLGDFLSIMAALMWAVYCLILKPLGKKYPTAFITRKVFLYSIISLLVYFLFDPLQVKTEVLFHPVVTLNLLFLGIVASMLCFIAWNAAVKVLGPSRTANYIYVQPFSTLVLSSIILSEVITLASMIGALCIIGGVYLAEKE
ncbi:MAG: DMT family transporter [Bacteroides sp]|nr:DMT family transporter [Bacteroides sp.]MBQ3191869.1 DMT family transporter [Bacteroides sp.]